MEMLQGVWKQHLRPRAVVGYGVKTFLPSPPNYVTRSPGVNCFILMFLQLGIGDANQEQCKEQQPGVLHRLEWVSGECHQIISPCPQY